MREAGLPLMTDDVRGETSLFFGSKGVVRAVYPDLWRVDLEGEDGSFFRAVPVVGPYFPELHKDGDAPSHVGYMHIRGSAQVFCWPLTYRRLLGPEDRPEGSPGSEPERRYYHTHGYIFRSGDITVRITKDHRIIFETEQNDYIILDQQRREIRLHAPTVFVGSDDASQANRIQYQQDDSIRAYNPLVILGTESGDRIEYMDKQHIQIVTPQWFMGKTGLPDADGITYLADSFLHLVSTAIKLTATESITLDPPRINFGNIGATERIILGNLFQTFLNAFLTLFNSHQHTNVQNGGGLSGPPQTPTSMMPDSTLSTVARVSQ